MSKLSQFGIALRRARVRAGTVGLSMGRGVVLGRNIDLKVTDDGSCEIGDHVSIAQNTILTVKKGRLKIGARSFVGFGSVLVAQSHISIGKDCLIAEHATIRDQDHKVDLGRITALNGYNTAPIVIGDNVWIGAKATILKGVSIGNNSVIAAGAVVTKDVPDNSIAKGVPATFTAINAEHIHNVTKDRAAAA